MKRGRDSLGGGGKKAKTDGSSPATKPQRKKNAREFYLQANRCVVALPSHGAILARAGFPETHCSR